MAVVIEKKKITDPWDDLFYYVFMFLFVLCFIVIILIFISSGPISKSGTIEDIKNKNNTYPIISSDVIPEKIPLPVTTTSK